MRKLLSIFVLVFAVYVAIALILICCTSPQTNALGFSRAFVATTSVHLFSGIATFLAVVWSLFGESITRRIKRPTIVLEAATDDVHCVFVENANMMSSANPERRVEIYVSAKNTSNLEAPDAQLVCNRVFVSSDGERFTPYRTFRAASFRWLYSTEDKKFLTTLRRSVEKYAKIAEVIDEEVDSTPDGPIGNSASSKKQHHTRLSLALALNETADASLRLEEKYVAMLIPICLASKVTPPKVCYVKIFWRGQTLESLPRKDKLEIEIITEDAARKAVEVKLN